MSAVEFKYLDLKVTLCMHGPARNCQSIGRGDPDVQGLIGFWEWNDGRREL